MAKDVCIRSLTKLDIEALNKIRRSEGVFESILSLKDETISETYQYFMTELDRSHTFIAEIDGDKESVVGYIKLVIDEEKRRKHKGRISIAVHKDYQGNGVGSKLFKAAIDLAKNWLMLKKLELTVLETNQNAIAMYEKYGFEVEGVFKEDTVVNGKYENVVSMGMIF